MKKLISIFCICVLFSACREDTPMTGTLQVSITLDTPDPSTAYALFTEVFIFPDSICH